MPKDDPARGNPVSEDAFDELEKMLASLFGEQMASDAVSALRSSGVDPSSIAQMPGVGDVSQLSPAQLLAMRAQFQQMFSASTAEPVILRLRGRPGVVRGERARGVDGVVLVWVRHALIMRHLPGEEGQLSIRTWHKVDTMPTR